MTSVSYEYDAQVRDGNAWVDLPVTNIAPDVDLDRVPYTGAILTLGPVTPTVWALLDPRTLVPATRGNVRWRIRQKNQAGTVIGYLPRVGSSTDQWALMHVRRIDRTLGETIVTVHGGETLLDDRLVIEETRYANKGWEISADLAKPTTLGGYVDKILTLTFGTTHATPLDATATAAAALGSPSRLDPGAPASGPYQAGPAPYGTSFTQLIETELSSVGCRLIDAWGIGWYITDRDHGPGFSGAPTEIKWTSHAAAPAGYAQVITEFSETVSRDGDWADTVVVTGTEDREEGPLVWRHSAAGGTHSRGKIMELRAAEPSGNLAASIASRAYRRGHDITITAQIDFAIVPGSPITVHLKSGPITAEIVAAAWDLQQGTVSVRARSAETTTPEAVTRDQTQTASGDRALSEAQRLASDAYASAVARIPGLTTSEQMAKAMEDARILSAIL